MFLQGSFNYRNITFIKVTDQLNSKSSNAIITDGGVGLKKVTMLFSNKKTKGFNFIYEIYGR